MSIWVGAGLGGLVVLISGELPVNAEGGETHGILVAASLTVGLICAGCLALARVGFEWAATQLQRAVARGDVTDEDNLAGDYAAWPAMPERMWRASLTLFLVASVTFLVAVWWWI